MRLALLSLLFLGGLTLVLLPFRAEAGLVSQELSAVADTYASSETPSSTHGSLTIVKVYSDPLRSGYLRFNVANLSGAVSRATLRVYVTLGSGTAEARAVLGSWSESTLTYNNAPALGPTVSTSGVFKAPQWVSMDVTPLVSGNGPVSVGLTTSGSSFRFASREMGAALAPRIVVESSSGSTSTSSTTAPSTPTTTTTTTTTTTPVAPTPGCARPYAGSSPWNTPIGSFPVYDPWSDVYVSSMQGVLTSDPTQYTYPVYYASSSSPLRRVYLSGRYSNVTGETTIQLQRGGTVSVPIPATAAAAAGSDAQLIILKPSTGDEWGFWRLQKDSAGTWHATNGYHYNTKWSGVPPKGFGSRGAGVPYLAGLVRPCEFARGYIDHALAFAYDYPAPAYVYPATKSDGKGADANDMPEGVRLQLDPRVTDAQLASWGCRGPCVVVAHALQQYGMYLIDASGREKVMMEYEGTAHWHGLVTSKTVNPIPLSAFRLVDSFGYTLTPSATP